VSVPRILNIFALLLFIVFVATFFTVLVRLSRIGLITERHAAIDRSPEVEEDLVRTEFSLLGQDTQIGSLNFAVSAEFDTQSRRFSGLTEGDPVFLRVENMIPDLRRNYDLTGTFTNLTGDRWVMVDLGEFRYDVLDRRDFYPFDGYEVSLNCAYYTYPGWFEPDTIALRSMTNLIFLNPRYEMTEVGREGFRMRIGRLRIQQFLAATLILIEILFLLYLLTVVDLQELLRAALGYLVGLFIIREILATRAPMFPTIIDYGTLFLFCVAFFLMLFKFLGGAEERALITIPQAWIDGLRGSSDNTDNKPDKKEDPAEKSEDDSAG
jgi:hypothetical protein